MTFLEGKVSAIRSYRCTRRLLPVDHEIYGLNGDSTLGEKLASAEWDLWSNDGELIAYDFGVGVEILN